MVVSCCFFRSALSRFNGNFQHYSQITPSTWGISTQRSAYQSPSKKKSTEKLTTLSWSILADYGATWFMFVLHRALLAVIRTFLCSFCILWHKLVIVWLLVPHDKYWHSQPYNNSTCYICCCTSQHVFCCDN